MTGNTRWHLDRHVPIAVIFAIALQTATAIWWASKQDSRIQQLESYVALRQGDGDRLIRIEEQLKYIANAVSDLKEPKRR